MTKRSAITMAAGLAVALLVGVAAISLTMGNGAVANAGGHHKPIVRHRVQTVTIHRSPDANASPEPVQVVHLGTSPASSTSDGATSGYEGTESDDDTFEGGSSGYPSGSPDAYGSTEAFGDD
jgi:hypothetical protein